VDKRVSRREFLRIAGGMAGGAAGALLLAGCGGAATSAPTAGKSASGAKPASVPSAAAGGEKGAKVLRLGHTLAPDSHYQKWAVKFGEELKQRTNGRYTVQVYPQSQLGGELRMVQEARAGTLDALISAQATVEPTVKPWEMFDMPYLFDSIDQGNRVLASKAGQTFLDMLPKYGLIGLGWGSVLERDVFTFDKPVRDLADMKGLKIRVMQSPGYVLAYRALGANPTPLAYDQLYLALKEHTVDGGDTSPDQFFQDKFAEICKYFSLTHVNYLPAAMLLSKSLWDKLSSSDKEAFASAGKAAAAYDYQVYKAAYHKYLDEMKPKGITLTKVDTGPWEKATEGVRKHIIDLVPDGKKLYSAIQAAKG
jgi:tripartite ATP-independent transporter DctP family solute receptor